MVNILYAVIFLLTFPFITLLSAQEDFGNFVDIEAYQNMPSNPCHENPNDARKFLQEGRKKCEIFAVLAVQQNQPNRLYQVSQDLVLVSQVAGQKNRIEVGVSADKKNCCQRVTLLCEQTILGLENYLIKNCSPSIAMQVARNKADRTEFFLQVSSIFIEKKEN